MIFERKDHVARLTSRHAACSPQKLNLSVGDILNLRSAGAVLNLTSEVIQAHIRSESGSNYTVKPDLMYFNDSLYSVPDSELKSG